MDETLIWNLMKKYFEDTGVLVEHHIESYNNFFNSDIFKIFKEKGPIRLESNYDESIKDYRNRCLMYFGGKNGDKIYFGKPIIYDDKDNVHYMFPNESRLRNMTYGITIHYDIDVEFIDILKPGEMPTIINQDDTVDPITESGDDYQTATQFKNVKETMEELNVFEEERVEGGAPRKKTQKKTREKHTKKPYKMTTKLSSEIKKATEDSMINDNVQIQTITLEKIYLGKMPIMLQSNLCILNGLSPDIKYSMGECKYDFGGYFIIQGKEKTVVCQEKFADNMLYIRKYQKEDDDEEEAEELKYLYSSEIHSISENVSKPQRTLKVYIVAPSPTYTNKQIVVNIPNVRQPIPLFIVFRALGIISDKAIIEMCLLNLDKYENFMDFFIPSVHDAGGITSQKLALEYIKGFVKRQHINSVMEILSDYFLPHVGEVNFTEKAYYLGYMVFRMLCVYNGIELPTDRDNFKYKRVELIGSLLYDLFSEYFTEQQIYIRKEYDRRLNLNLGIYSNDLKTLINSHKNDIFKKRILESGINKAFKGNWGAHSHTKRIGILQDLNRRSYNDYLAHLRKTNLQISAEKLVPPRLLHSSQWGYIDPVDTPDGGNIGLHKSLAMTTHITRGSGSREPIIKWLRENITLKVIDECSPMLLSNMTKVFVNGYWCGAIFDPYDCVNKIKLYRRNALIPIDTSVTFDIKLNTIFIYTDSGRLCRPIFYKDDLTKKLSFENSNISKLIKNNEFEWKDLVTGFNKKKISNFDIKHSNIYELSDLYDGVNKETNPLKLDRFIKEKAILDYIDCSESENALICINYDDFNSKDYTHLEIDSSVIFGLMGNQIVYPENNQAPRNMFSCGQTKQACSLYHSNYFSRMDKTSIVLNTGQVPLVKSRYNNFINNDEMPYGENTIVAIMCYGGYNMEDSILINEGSLKRGLFSTTYYSTYEAHEEISESNDGTTRSTFANIEKTPDVIKNENNKYDYSNLNNNGIIKENTKVDEKTVIIGQYTQFNDSNKIDISKTPKKGQIGAVDKSFITDGDEGERITKVKIREYRSPNLGDKMASRAGQKGTIGLIIKEADMPFTRDGLRPDIIINPHAIPSRMTVGQLVESITGKACVIKGGFGDCTPFINKGSKVGVFGEMLTENGYHSSGNDILYNGMTGEQIESEIFMGPTYYMRLKHMVKDKINYRARGPTTALTRQPVSGRANDGGLRIGEMERDVIVSHGAVNFTKESYMERCDKYKMAVCNNTGMIAIYNPDKNLFLSPMCDGPIKFSGSINDDSIKINNISKYGRNFSIIEVPYSLKLLIQELMAANIQLRIVTQDNIKQIENMSFSKNIENLSGIKDPIEMKKILKEILDKHDSKDEFKTDVSYLTDDLLENFEEKENISDDSPEWKPPSTPSDYSGTPIPNSKSPQYPSDKVYTPSTPDFSPPNDDELSGGKKTKIDEITYNVGEQVVYHDDEAVPKSLWTITKMSPNFITIERNRDDDIINPEKDIKIIRSDKISRPGDMLFTENNEQQQQVSHTSNPIDNVLPSKITIAPVINVLGNENKDIQLPAPNLNESNEPPIYENDMIFKAPTESNDNKKEEKIIDNSTDISQGNFVIKKV